MIRVAIVDDFDLLREDLCELIAGQEDMEVVWQAGSGQEAVEKAKKQDADIVLMDIEMETIRAGILAAEQIRDQGRGQQVIFLTAHETDPIIITAMGTGAVDYVVKGCQDADILRHIRNAYGGKPVMESRIQETIMREYTRLQRSERSLLFFINNVSQLTVAERELLRLLLDGKKVKDIAQIRCVEIITVKTQIKGLLRKFGCSRTKEIVSMIQELNISHLF
ncbi:MAG: response regulator transcription factor [Lachnospiraceae bacterium]|jgi:DNA-binding NarL/FixJ family response regulator|nr:response regulator transcription factor [Lachnospiraceae bacterium]